MSGIILRVLAVSEHQIHTNPGLDSELSDLMTATPSQIWTVENSITVNNQVLAVAMTQGSMAMVSLGVWSYGTTVLCVVVTEWNFISCMTILVRHIANEAQRPWSCAHGKLELALMLAFIQGSVCLFEPAAWTLLEISILQVSDRFSGMCRTWQPQLVICVFPGTAFTAVNKSCRHASRYLEFSFSESFSSRWDGSLFCLSTEREREKRERAQRWQGGDKWLEALSSDFLFKIKGKYKTQLNIATCLQNTVSTSSIRV